MMRAVEQAERSIGEVLALLKTEFSDITISKIRFLESQGLVTPKRTASGYRKFSDGDVARLRYILREQKEHFLPLKVIKDRLSTPAADSAPEAASIAEPLSPASAPTSPEGVSSVFLRRSEILEATDLSEQQLRELEGFGLVRSEKSGRDLLYSNHALTVAKIAARFLAFGVEARHLRIFATAADREADLYRQLTVSSPATTRNTQARMDMLARLEQLVELGAAMRAELLQVSLDHPRQ